MIETSLRVRVEECDTKRIEGGHHSCGYRKNLSEF